MPALDALQEVSKGLNCGQTCSPNCRCVDELVRELVKRFSNDERETLQNEEILIDTDIEGARYILVRLPIPSQAAPSLSPREQEIVRMVSKGLPNKVIAGVLNISSWTVSTHLRRIFAKLGVTSRAAMVAQFLDGHATHGSHLPPLRDR
jgi:DNA-binding CsgD family transcriptional regulator